MPRTTRVRTARAATRRSWGRSWWAAAMVLWMVLSSARPIRPGTSVGVGRNDAHFRFYPIFDLLHQTVGSVVFWRYRLANRDGDQARTLDERVLGPALTRIMRDRDDDRTCFDSKPRTAAFIFAFLPH